MAMPEKGRLAAHVLLDAASVWSESVNEEANTEVMNLALHRLDDIGPVKVEQDDTTGQIVVDVSQLAGGAVVALQWLISRLAEGRGFSREVVINDLRAFLDE